MTSPSDLTEARRPLPDQVTMGLLAYLTAHAVDEDYAHAAARRASPGPARSRRQVGVAGALALVVFAVLTVTAAAQTSQNSSSEERERRALIDQVRERKTALAADRKSVTVLQTQNNQLRSDLLRTTSASATVLRQLRLLAVRAGTEAARGPGVEVDVDNARNVQSDRQKVLDKDLQKLVNGLWVAGAEAISINGQRLTNLTAIRHAGSAITVNYTRLSPPYRVLAIGDPNSLPALFAQSTSGQTWLDLQRQFGLRFSMRTQSALQLPAAAVPNLRFASTAGSPSGKGLS